jgi:hypothetical protein
MVAEADDLSSRWALMQDLHNPKDNIELAAKLISQIAKRLDDPSIENIYSL